MSHFHTVPCMIRDTLMGHPAFILRLKIVSLVALSRRYQVTLLQKLSERIYLNNYASVIVTWICRLILIFCVLLLRHNQLNLYFVQKGLFPKK